MKKCLVFSLIFFAKFALSQVHDNFDDGNFQADPAWTGSNSGNDFRVVNNQLRSDCTTPNTSFYLSTPSSLSVNCVWEFYCNLQLATSGSNYVDVYLISDQSNLLASNINGYFVRIGGTNDEISLFKRSGPGSSGVRLIDGIDGSVNSSTNNRIKIRVSRSSAGGFKLEREITGAGSYVSEGSVTDTSFISSVCFGISIYQSSSGFFQKHFFDDIAIYELVADQKPPEVVSATILTENTLQVTFNEPLDESTSLNPANYLLNNSFGNPVAVVPGAEPNNVILRYSSPFSSGSYTISVARVADRSNNIIGANNTATFSYIQPYKAKTGDVLINELFADPSPQIDLPGTEFVEIWNTSNENIELNDWKFSDPGSIGRLPSCILAAGDYLILCPRADTAEFKSFGKVLGVSPWPSLNNSGDVIKLISGEGILIDSVSYNDSWYKDPAKKTGGWSLEMIDPDASCKGGQNWSASNDSAGGTPGRKNSIFQINKSSEPLRLLRANLSDSVTLRLDFNRPVDSVSASQPSVYQINNGVGQPIGAEAEGSGFTRVELKFNKALVRGKTYQVTVSGITDCAGIYISQTDNTASVFYPDKIFKNDILISEILFNPRPEGADFVEVYNNSNKTLDLQDLSLGTVKADTLANLKPVSQVQRLLAPAEYLVLTTDPENIRKEYRIENPNAFLRMSSMPAYNDDAGTVVLQSRTSTIDQFSYTSKMHFRLIRDQEGISLERVSFKSPANEKGNFRSAASSASFGTPGYKNSQAIDDTAQTEEWSLVSNTFSPDNDGFEDALIIRYKCKEPGAVLNSNVYDTNGRLIKRIARNMTLAAEGTLSWDGLDETNLKAPVGIYIVYLELFDLKGNLKKYRKTCALAVKL